MEQRERAGPSRAGSFEDPSTFHTLLTESWLAWPWLVLRVSVGWVWLEGGWHQLQHGGSGNGWPAHAGAIGLTLAGIALILGAFVGIAAFAGGLLGISLLPAGVGLASALLFAATVWLVITWKTAGWIGLDRWLLPLLGMPWRGGILVDRATQEPSPPTPSLIAMGEGEREPGVRLPGPVATGEGLGVRVRR
jgi:thiosulfate dehydrogenase [quinone] large subunit